MEGKTLRDVVYEIESNLIALEIDIVAVAGDGGIGNM
jgi:hypothetical protein